MRLDQGVMETRTIARHKMQASERRRRGHLDGRTAIGTDRWRDKRTDRLSYRDTRMHLKISKELSLLHRLDKCENWASILWNIIVLKIIFYGATINA